MIVAFNNKNTWEEDYGKPFYKVQLKVSSPQLAYFSVS